MSLISTSWTFGTFIGPIVTGTLVERVGYCEMQCLLGRSCLALFVMMTRLLILIIAVICLLSSVYTYFDLDAHWNPAIGPDEFELCRRDP